MRLSPSPVVLLLLLGAASACGPTPPPGEGVLGTWDDRSGVRHITFMDDNTMEGDDGCNGFGGIWTESEAGFELELRGFRTLRACPSIDTWLGSSPHARLEGDVLVFFDDVGREKGRLIRAVPRDE